LRCNGETNAHVVVFVSSLVVVVGTVVVILNKYQFSNLGLMFITSIIKKDNKAGTYVVVFVIYVGTVVVTLRKYLVFSLGHEREINAHVAVFVCSLVVVVGTVVVILNKYRLSHFEINVDYSRCH
jgi:hypothetical protein